METTPNQAALSAADAHTLAVAIQVLGKVKRTAATLSWENPADRRACYGQLDEAASMARTMLYNVLLVAGISCDEQPARARLEHLTGG